MAAYCRQANFVAMESQGIIRQSKSSGLSLLNMVEKSDGMWWLLRTLIRSWILNLTLMLDPEPDLEKSHPDPQHCR